MQINGVLLAAFPTVEGAADSVAAIIARGLIPAGLDLRSVHLDARGAWEMTLGNGVDIRLGRREIEDRTALFLDVVAGIVAGRAAEIDFVDMRYSNGFTIGWKDVQQSRAIRQDGTREKLLAGRIE